MGEQFHLDALIWCGLCIIVAAVPLCKQLAYKDAKIDLDCGHMTHMAEAMWRDWFRRSGIPRRDFKRVLDCGEWLELLPGSNVPMFAPETSVADTRSYCDVYYYVVDGCLECRSCYKEGNRNFTARAGSFVDAMSLIGFLGQPTAALAMQLGPLDVKVALTSTFSLAVPLADDSSGSPTLTSPAGSPLASPKQHCDSRCRPMLRSTGQSQRSPSAEFARRGALLLRLRRSELLERVVCGPGLASAALRLTVTQSTLDNLFCESITACQPAVRRRYDVIHDMRQRLNHEALPLNAADIKYPIWKQWWRAHSSLRDFCRPGPEQRAMNAIRLATQEEAQMEELRVHESELERLQSVGTPLSSPHGSRADLSLGGVSRSTSRERLSTGSSSPVRSGTADLMVEPVSTVGGNFAIWGELREHVSDNHTSQQSSECQSEIRAG